MRITRDEDNATLHAVLDGEVLLPCPFCGSVGMELTNFSITRTTHYWVECWCGAKIDGDSYPNAEDEADHIKAAESAVAAWNKRISPAAVFIPIHDDVHALTYLDTKTGERVITTVSIAEDGTIGKYHIDMWTLN